MKSLKNVPASVRQRLLDLLKKNSRPFNELLQYYAMERFLYRLTQSIHANCFILKGALMLRAWNSPLYRATMDIDLLGMDSNVEADIIRQIKNIIAVAVNPDGLIFYPDSIRIERITEGSDIHGMRVLFLGALDSAKVNMQVDIGFGDLVHAGPKLSELPVLLGNPTPKLLCYSLESAIAEKFEAMVKLGMLNSRMKDFYDIWILSRQFNFDRMTLVEAIRLTFRNRKTAFPLTIVAFEQSFIDAKQIQWNAFHKRLQQADLPISFGVIVGGLKHFLVPVTGILSAEIHDNQKWIAPGTWV